jgi:hypothetical protein
LASTIGYVAQYAGVAVMGAGTGLGELVSRYKDRPTAAIRSRSGMLYIAINAAASIAALGLILTYGWKFGASGDAVVPTRLLLAGFGAMALFRASLFTVRVGNSDVGVGPSTFLSLVLASCDRGVDRTQAEERAEAVRTLMADVDYDKAKDGLPEVALALMQNLDAPDQAALGVQLQKLEDRQDLSPHAKSLAMGLALATVVGPNVLEGAKKALGREILVEKETGENAETGVPAPPAPDPQARSNPRGMPATPQTPSDPEAGP